MYIYETSTLAQAIGQSPSFVPVTKTAPIIAVNSLAANFLRHAEQVITKLLCDCGGSLTAASRSLRNAVWRGPLERHVSQKLALTRGVAASTEDRLEFWAHSVSPCMRGYSRARRRWLPPADLWPYTALPYPSALCWWFYEQLPS